MSTPLRFARADARDLIAAIHASPRVLQIVLGHTQKAFGGLPQNEAQWGDYLFSISDSLEPPGDWK